MWPFSRRRKPSWRGVDFARVVPERLVDCEDGGPGQDLTLLTPRYTGPLWGRLLQPRLGSDKRHIRIPLEERGAFLWRHIDGQRDIAALARLFCEAFPEDAEQAAERISTYVYAMAENGFIRLVHPADLP